MKIKLGLSLLAFATNFCFAYKLDTHLYIGSEVIQDVVDDGHVTIAPFGRFKVNPRLALALQHQPKSFLYGTIGPDFFPDVIAGQMIIHPGAAVDSDGGIDINQWNTDDWFAHMLTDADQMTLSELAFSHGFVVHGASDFWAHSFVNTHSGNIFNLTDGDGAEAEIRHYSLEGFINRFTPNARTNQGELIGKGIELLNRYPGEFPSDYIVQKLMLRAKEEQLGPI